MIVGTAGHVDHGKTSLVKALTGIDTDRLPEEKKRGITLELGFAHLDLPDGQRVGVVDVPGHERFVKAMAAGAGGIDLALLVVAADEGVMPQTREHVDICSLLGVRAGLLVVTKADLLPGLDAGWLELLEADLRACVAGTVFEQAPLLTVSAKSGEGLDALKAAIAKVTGSLAARSDEGPLFMPIDRAFTIKGFGCVVTGTVLSGRLSADEEVSLVPGLEGPLRLRGLQAHGAAVQRVTAGARAAVNLIGVEAAQVHRGMALVRAGEGRAVKSLDVELQLLSSVEAALPRRSRALVTIGTAQVEGVLALLDVEALRPGESCFAQLRLGAPVAATPAQRFIIRGTRALPGRGATIGGGRILAVETPRRRRGAGEKLQALAQAAPEARLVWLLTEAGYSGLTEAELFARASLSAKELSKTLETAAARGRVTLVDKEARRFLSGEVLRALVQRGGARLEAFHGEHPERDGMGREELRQRLGVPHERTFAKVLTALVEGKRAELAGELVRVPGRGRTFDDASAALKASLVAALAKAGLAPPTSTDLAATLRATPARAEQLLKVLVAEGLAVRVGEHYFDAAAVQALEAKVLAFFASHPSMTTQQFKELTGQSRKYVIPLAEYFDAQKLTLRVGETRTLRRKE